MSMRRVCASVAAGLALTGAALAGTAGGQAPAASDDLLVRVGLTADEASKARSGEAIVRGLPPHAPTEIAAVAAIRIRGDLERLVVWLKDIESFRKAAGTTNVGVIGRPARPDDFARLSSDGLDVDALRRCRPGDCDIRMPSAFLDRFSRDVPWDTPQAPAAAATLARTMLAEYASAYQAGGDTALGSHHDQSQPQAIAAEFQDMLRRATSLWRLAYPFASYLETFPKARPDGVEDNFYWTRETDTKQPVTTLHHIVLQRLPDKSLRLADKQFYASRDLDTALLIGQATPTADGRTFDMVIALRARSPRLSGMAARVLRGRIEREVADTLKMYLDWLQRNYALG